MGKNVIIFGANISWSVHVDNKNKNILILVEGPTQGLVDTTLTAEAKYSIDFKQPRERLALSLDYNGSNSFLFGYKNISFQSKRLWNKRLHSVFV